MLAILNALKTLKPWQIVVLVAVVFGVAGATYGVYAILSGPDRAGLADDQQLIPVQYGNLVNQVSTNGSLTFPNRETLTFGSQGSVAEVLVEAGQPVVAGQALAKLDRTTLASLSQAVAQARVDLQTDEDALDELRNPPLLSLAQARQEVADAQSQLQAAVETLADTMEPYTPRDIKVQEEAVASARSALQEAREALAGLAPDHTLLLAQVRQAKADAELALQEAQSALADLEPDHARQLVQARQIGADAEVALEQALEALAEFQPDHDQDLVEARQARADAEVALELALEALAEFQPDHDRDLVEARQAWADSEVALDQAQNALDTYEDANSRRLTDARAEKAEAETRLEETQTELSSLLRDAEAGATGLAAPIQLQQEVVQIYQSRLEQAQEGVAEVDQLAAAVELALANLDRDRAALSELEMGPDEVKRQQLARAVDSAKADLDRANDDLAKLEEGIDSVQRQQLEAAVDLARADLDAAREDLAQLEQGLDLLEWRQLEAAVEMAAVDLEAAIESQESVKTEADPGDVELRRAKTAAAEIAATEAAEDALAAILAGVDPTEVALEEAKVALARATLAQANEDLAELLEGPDLVEVALRENQVAVARAALAQAEDDLAEQLGGPDPLDVALLEARINSSWIALEDALERLEKATLEAPFDGFVSLVDVEDGDEVNPNTSIVEIVDPTVVEVDGVVDEIDVLLIREGIRATVTMDSLPGQTLDGTISEVAPAALNQQGVVTYPIRIRVQAPDGVQLREGLSATAAIVLREERDVLLVPQQALYGSFEQPVVRVMTNGGVQERQVVLGNSDDFWTAVREGLAEGDQVVMEAARTTSDPFAAFRQLRGGFGGGGARPPGGGGGSR